MKHERSIMLAMVLLLIMGWTVHEQLSGTAWLVGMILVFGALGIVGLLIHQASSRP